MIDIKFVLQTHKKSAPSNSFGYKLYFRTKNGNQTLPAFIVLSPGYNPLKKNNSFLEHFFI